LSRCAHCLVVCLSGTHRRWSSPNHALIFPGQVKRLPQAVPSSRCRRYIHRSLRRPFADEHSTVTPFFSFRRAASSSSLPSLLPHTGPRRTVPTSELSSTTMANRPHQLYPSSVARVQASHVDHRRRVSAPAASTSQEDLPVHLPISTASFHIIPCQSAAPRYARHHPPHPPVPLLLVPRRRHRRCA
jgi:hypothetical protein